MTKSIAYITDLHLDDQVSKDHEVYNRSNVLSVLEDISSRGIERIVLGGDLGEVESYPWLFDKLSAFHISITLGNHDQMSDVLEFFKPTNEADSDLMFYTDEDDHHKYLFFDSSAGLITRKQLDWLENEIKTKKQIIFFIHHPVLAVDSVVDKKYALIGREAIVEILNKRNGVVNVFCGHYHCEDVQTAANIIQYTTPAVSFQVQKNTEEVVITNDSFGYRLIHIEEEKVTTEVIRF